MCAEDACSDERRAQVKASPDCGVGIHEALAQQEDWAVLLTHQLPCVVLLLFIVCLQQIKACCQQQAKHAQSDSTAARSEHSAYTGLGVETACMLASRH